MRLTTHELVQVIIDRISDYESDPEPVYDEFLQTIPNHARLQLKHALIQSYTEYTKEISQG